MVSFQKKLATGLEKRNVAVIYDLNDHPYESVLVIGGTRNFIGLKRAMRRGVRIVQRLDGMNWMHRARRTGGRHFARAVYGNMVLAFIRARLADHIVYQSHFSREWWERARGKTRVPNEVVYNGVDLEVFSPQGSQMMPGDYMRLLVVEGRLAGGYETGLENAINLAEVLARQITSKGSPTINGGEKGWLPVELMVVGRIEPALRKKREGQSGVNIRWIDHAPPEAIPEIDRSAHLLFSADLNAACPNSVIEALACGTPVVSFDTGALPELVTASAGKIVSYGGNPWRLDPPDIPALATAAMEILANLAYYKEGARSRAVEAFALEEMVDRYLKVLLRD
jgi:glycosyltransferase involved in cell wall biosynthesis